MKILLNGNPIEVEGLTPEVTITSLIEAVGAEVKDSGLTIVQVTADGVAIDPGDPRADGDRRVVECDTIELTAATAQELLQIMVNDSAEVIPYFGEVAQGIAGDLRVGKIKEALDRYLELVDGLEWLATVLTNLQTGFAKVMQESGQEMRREQLLARVTEQLATLRTSQENQDWVGLADVLEYEFPGLFEETLNLLTPLKSA